MKNDLTISVSDTAFMQLLLAGIEAYKLRSWGTHVRQGFTETCGVLWGYSRSDIRRDDHVRIEQVSVDAHTEKAANWVNFNDESNMNKKRVVEARWPHLCLIGDFHTHPYDNYSQAKRDRGWEFSKVDRESLEENDFCGNLWSDCRVSLVLTIAKLKRVREKQRIDPDPAFGELKNVLYWQMDNYRFWLSGYTADKVNKESGKYSFIVSPRHRGWPCPPRCENSRARVRIDVPTVTGSSHRFKHGAID